MTRRPSPDPEILQRLRAAEIDVLGRMPWSSNGTYLVQLIDEQALEDGEGPKAVYKPGRGERPLWDFPPGLYKREVAAYELGAALGWWVVPPTVRRDGPLGEGSLQLFIDADFEQHYFTLQDVAEHRWDFQAICALDLVANNTDRKSGHCLLGPDGRIWAIDNGLCFAEEFKVRTVLWDFGGEPIPDDLLADLRRLHRSGLPDVLSSLLDRDELAAMAERLASLVKSARFPVDRTGRRYPWPLV